MSTIKAVAGGLVVKKKPLLEWETDEKHDEHMLHTDKAWLRLVFSRGEWVAAVWPPKSPVMEVPLATMTIRVGLHQLGTARAAAMALFESLLEEL